MSSGTDLAPDGKVWRCGACGKLSRTQYGFVDDGTERGGDFTPDGNRVASPSWDESCMMNARLIDGEFPRLAAEAKP